MTQLDPEQPSQTAVPRRAQGVVRYVPSSMVYLMSSDRSSLATLVVVVPEISRLVHDL